MNNDKSNSIDITERVLSIIANAIAIISAISVLISGIVAKNIIIALTSTIILLIAIIFILIINNAKKVNELISKNQISLDNIHNNLIHKIRNEIVALNEIKNDVLKMDLSKENDLNDYYDLYNDKLNELREKLLPCVNDISNYLSSLLNQKISTCIKIFAYEHNKSSVIYDNKLITLVRSDNTDYIRRNELPNVTSITGNTDFMRLASGKKYFGCGNLCNKYNQSEYNNTTTNWKDFYKSTLVVPIRFHKNYINPRAQEVPPRILGMLCIDSKSENMHWEDGNSLELKLLASYADMIFIYFNAFLECFQIS